MYNKMAIEKIKIMSFSGFIKLIMCIRVYLRCYQVGVIQKSKTFYYNHELADQR